MSSSVRNALLGTFTVSVGHGNTALTPEMCPTNRPTL